MKINVSCELLMFTAAISHECWLVSLGAEPKSAEMNETHSHLCPQGAHRLEADVKYESAVEPRADLHVQLRNSREGFLTPEVESLKKESSQQGRVGSTFQRVGTWAKARKHSRWITEL